MKYIVTINNKNYEVEVEKGQATVVGTTQTVAVAAKPVEQAAPVPAAPAAAPAAAAVQQSVAGEPVKAPMPGVILDIKVSSGASVKKGDVLFILEAMKMENEITAPKDGVVAQISAAKGASVVTGDLLAVLQ
ncbi:biotin-dependent enzyme [Anaerobacterium chartisolvens]|uniref:Biotin-dependent enzyme n=1 Tax=Anaerobacterium chartisolvens TaxID=1297424 RepID=A0A369AKN6_9FIRM|nr:biotin/lipoyl-containing protein [Anaerobacterium chartisolvens]RCX08898.1 biotin-dependent enzyme [Anaerobacterium chartisolvens]